MTITKVNKFESSASSTMLCKTQHGPNTLGTHFTALDGLRGTAICMVLVFHFCQGMTDYLMPEKIERMLRLASIGQKGVDLFFVLSGFLITSILLRTKDTPRYFRNFYVRRMLRIFPLYFAVVFGCLLVGVVFSMPQFQWSKTWWYLAYIQNFASTFWRSSIGGPGHFWSLAVEEHFYLFWPFAVWYFSSRVLAALSLGLIILAIWIRMMFLQAGLDVFTFTLCRMDTLALGALLAVLYTNSVHWASVVKWTRWLVAPVGGIAFGSFFVLSGSGNPTLQAFKYTLFAFLCASVLVLALSAGKRNPLPDLFSAPWLRGMGKTSYAMYVFHPFIFGFVIGRFYQASWSPLHGMIWLSLIFEFTLAISMTVLVSWISWVLFEQPLLKIKKQFQ